MMHEWARFHDEAANHQLPIFLNHLNSFQRGLFKSNAKFNADSLFHLLSHFECDGHTVHELTQGHLSSPLTSTVKSLLFTHAHSSPLLAARLHRCCSNCSCYVNNGWTFSRQIFLFIYSSLQLLYSSLTSGSFLCFLSLC